MRPLLMIAVLAALLAATASAATQDSLAGASTHVDQATVDVDYAVTGRQLQINASNVVTVSPDGVVSATSGAVASIADYFNGGASNYADCYPVGNEFAVDTLPAGALRFGPTPHEATLQATFTCIVVPWLGGGEFPLVVNLAWSGDTPVLRGGGGGWTHGYWAASITGSASDGTTEFVGPTSTNAIIHQTY